MRLRPLFIALLFAQRNFFLSLEIPMIGNTSQNDYICASKITMYLMVVTSSAPSETIQRNGYEISMICKLK